MIPEELFDKYIDIETGDKAYNLDILATFTKYEAREYFDYCMKHPKEKTPWHFALEKRFCPMFGGGEFNPYFYVEKADAFSEVAVLADERDADGKIIPYTIHTVLEYAPYGTSRKNVDKLKAYGEYLSETYYIAPKLVLIGKKPSDSVEEYIHTIGIDLTFIMLK